MAGRHWAGAVRRVKSWDAWVGKLKASLAYAEARVREGEAACDWAEKEWVAAFKAVRAATSAFVAVDDELPLLTAADNAAARAWQALSQAIRAVHPVS
jgi:hypothetical protein